MEDKYSLEELKKIVDYYATRMRQLNGIEGESKFRAINDRLSQLENAYAVFHRLRKTKDGVAVLPGDVVYGRVKVDVAGSTKDYGVREHKIHLPLEHTDSEPDEWLAIWKIPMWGAYMEGETDIEETYSNYDVAVLE